MKVTDLKEKDGILCTTKEEADQICKLMHEAWLKWSSGESYLKNHIRDFLNDETVYYPADWYCLRKKQAKVKSHRIYLASYFLEENTEDSKYPLYHTKLEAIEKIWQCTDLVVINNCIKMMERSIVGMDKYWVWLDRDDYTEDQWLTHLEEELMDAINYIWAKKHNSRRKNI